MSNGLSEGLLASEEGSERPEPARTQSQYLRADTLQVLRKNPGTFKIRSPAGGRFRSDEHIESLDCACTACCAGLSPARAHGPSADDLFESKVNREAFFRQKDYDMFSRARWVLIFCVGSLPARDRGGRG